MISKKEAFLQAPGTGSLLLLTVVLSMGGFPAAGDGVLEPRITNLETISTATQIKIATLETNVEHFNDLAKQQIEQNEKIYNLLLQLCQSMASISDNKCTT